MHFLNIPSKMINTVIDPMYLRFWYKYCDSYQKIFIMQKKTVEWITWCQACHYQQRRKKLVRKLRLTSRGLTFFISKPLTSSLYYKQGNAYFQNVFSDNRTKSYDRGNIKVRTHTYSGVLMRVLKFMFKDNRPHTNG